MSGEIMHSEGWFENEEAPGEAAVNPLMVVHRCLRGRYPLALVLALALAIPCGILGYLAVAPEYTSVGVVSVAPTRSFLLYQNEMNEPMTAFDSYVRSHANKLRGSRVMDVALTDPKLRQAGWPPAPEGAIDLMQSLQVSVGNREQDIFVSVTHEEPVKARAAVDAVLAAYTTLAIDVEQQEIRDKLDELDKLRRRYRTEADQARNDAQRIAELEGTDDLERRRDAKHDQWANLERLIDAYKLELVSIGDLSAVDGGESTPPLPAGGGPSVEELAQSDGELRRFLAQRDAIRTELASLQRRYSAEHRAVLAAQEDLEATESMIEARASLVRGGPGVVSSGERGVMADQYTAQRLRAQLQTLEALKETTKAEAKRLGSAQLQIEQKRATAARADEEYRLADQRYRALETESQAGSIGRIEIAQSGSTPYIPSTDRRIPLAVIGGLGGGGLGVGLVALMGLVRPKYRFIDDLSSPGGQVYIFGAVPELNSHDPESRELVAASIAQVRSVIDARLLGTSDRALVHVVTSAGASEGKSTISLRLAKSFAATGRKTLLIDSDMVGQRLTAEFGMLDRRGFAGAVTGRFDPVDSVFETPVRDLFLMPCGRTDMIEPEQISARRAASLLEPLCEEYQAIVIDTGPILGSLEAQAVSSVCDEVLLVVTRGRQVRQVRMAIERLRRLGAGKVGVVFNRASPEDVERSTSISVTSERMADVRSRWSEHGPGGHGANGTSTAAATEGDS